MVRVSSQGEWETGSKPVKAVQQSLKMRRFVRRRNSNAANGSLQAVASDVIWGSKKYIIQVVDGYHDLEF